MGSLAEVLSESQRIGLIGPGPLDGPLDQARCFARAVPADAGRLVDVGSGGGLPALVIAVERPDLTLTLVERRGRACDFLRRAVRTLGVADRVTVVEADLADLGHDPAWRASFPVATARGVGPPAMVAELVLPLVHPGGRLIASVAGEVDRWPDRGLAVLGAHVVARHDGLVIVQAGECPTRFPRRRRQPSVFDLGG